MSHGLPRWFRLLFVAVMLVLCAVLVTQIVRQQSLVTSIDDLQGKLDSAQKRLALQQKQLREATEELPLVLAELETAAPAAAAAEARKDELKAQRNTLSQEVAAQRARIAELQAQHDTLPNPDETAQTVDATTSILNNAMTSPTE